MLKSALTTLLLALAALLAAQTVDVLGTVTDVETGRRLDRARVSVLVDGNLVSDYLTTGRNGTFELRLPGAGEYALEIRRAGYYEQIVRLDVEEGQRSLRANVPIERLPGYGFEFTMRELLTGDRMGLGDTISGVRIEIYDITDGRTVQDSTLVEANEEFTLARGHRYAFLLRRAGYFAKRFDVLVDVEGCILCFEGIGSQFEPNVVESLSGADGPGAVLADIPMRKIVIGEEVEIPNIYYDFDRATIRADARPTLIRLAQQLRATPVDVTLGSHTDARGTAEYNRDLSQRRAQSVVDFLEQRSVAEGRITARGFGESQLTNRCSDGVQCTEPEHQENRRTTFTVTKLLLRSTFENRSLEDLIEDERATRRRAVEVLEGVRE